jgi:ketosteroid isomerase-like protein
VPASLELVKIALQAYANGDCEIALALAGPHVRWDERASRTDGDLVWGHDKVQRAMRRYLDGWEDYRFEIEDLAEVGPGKVVGICRERGKPEDGPPVDRRFGGLWVVEGGKITSWATYLTPREAVRAAKELLGGRVAVDQVKRTAPLAEAKPIEPAPKPIEPAPEPIEPAEPTEPALPIEAADSEHPQPQPSEPQGSERSRKRPLTKSEEQKRAARARAQMRKRASRQSA